MEQSAGFYRPRALLGPDALWRFEVSPGSRTTRTNGRRRQKGMNRTAKRAGEKGQAGREKWGSKIGEMPFSSLAKNTIAMELLKSLSGTCVPLYRAPRKCVHRGMHALERVNSGDPELKLTASTRCRISRRALFHCRGMGGPIKMSHSFHFSGPIRNARSCFCNFLLKMAMRF